MQWLIDRFVTQPDRTAFIHEGRHVSYGDVIRISEAFSIRLDAMGIRAGDRIAILADYSPEVFCFILAITRAGLCPRKCTSRRIFSARRSPSSMSKKIRRS